MIGMHDFMTKPTESIFIFLMPRRKQTRIQHYLYSYLGKNDVLYSFHLELVLH